jgi:hypothetical protein
MLRLTVNGDPMQRRHLAALVAVVTAVAAVSVLLFTGGQSEPKQALALTPASIPQLPEQDVAPPIDDAAVTALERCISNAGCTLVHTRAFSNATVEVYQENSTPPAVHVQTIFADSVPSVWSLKDEHSATFKSMTCGLANCLLDVVVGPELLATIDMRMVSDQLSGKIEGAAVGPALQTQAADLNADGVLDLTVTEHLIQGDGTELIYYRTYVNDERDLVATGCTVPNSLAQPPTELQVRTCPTS